MTVRLFNVVTENTSLVIGLSYGQLVELNTGSVALAQAESLKERLSFVGCIPAWVYDVDDEARDTLCARPLEQISLRADMIEEIEPIRRFAKCSFPANNL
ncbi:MAG: hypothetical protein OER96_10990 [Gammaproteobacteria bacterium]|nr:hypothetical protein [Gammaproteobacteria bacterium]